MKTFTRLAALPALLFLRAVAQSIEVTLPAADTILFQGQPFVVQVVQPDSIISSIEVGLAIGVLHCTATPCQADPITQLGDVLYYGPYDPEFHEPGQQPYQNFTVTIPEGEFDGQTGIAQLGVVRLRLIGAGPSATLDQVAVSVTVE
ncbi:hypothetical protein BDP27DRAFT_1295460 [Rhodocollybia butyracea]|uniref:Uncharacterized protein n=1 Tax=Rhodocollybia butyracea TaxID=206335 RepID=A0A9P5U6U9_9AGAR|nr:hypothetical protein BDP27DRAFT_1295460 [Rhodocollybia butyracea]